MDYTIESPLTEKQAPTKLYQSRLCFGIDEDDEAKRWRFGFSSVSVGEFVRGRENVATWHLDAEREEEDWRKVKRGHIWELGDSVISL